MKFSLVFCAVLAVCGLSTSIPLQHRIYGGFAATTNQFPHQVGLTIPTPQGQGTCGGSIISPTWVLTAAHCNNISNQVTVRFGSLNRLNGGIAQVSFRLIWHPNFNRFLNNDVGVIGLNSPLTFTNAIRPIRLTSRSQFNNNFLNFQATVSGWGENGSGNGVELFLRWVNVRVISNADCVRAYGPFSVINHVVCTVGSGRVNAGVCGGDSGSPLIINEGGISTQIGIVAFENLPSRGGCSTVEPSDFMRTTHFLDWIHQHTGVAVRP